MQTFTLRRVAGWQRPSPPPPKSSDDLMAENERGLVAWSFLRTNNANTVPANKSLADLQGILAHPAVIGPQIQEHTNTSTYVTFLDRFLLLSKPPITLLSSNHFSLMNCLHQRRILFPFLLSRIALGLTSVLSKVYIYNVAKLPLHPAAEISKRGRTTMSSKAEGTCDHRVR